jgi:hypothetical protein
MRKIRTLLICAGLVILPAIAAADNVRTETVKFPVGTAGTEIQGRIVGRDSINYKIGASAGQNMTVELASKSGSVYFNVFEPGKKPGQDEAVFIGSTGGNVFSGTLNASGDYLVQVYLVRSAARRGEKASFSLKIDIAALGERVTGDALVPGTKFHATGEIPCAVGEGQPMGNCNFGVVRKGGGSAIVTVFLPDGGQCDIVFDKGDAVSSDAGGEMVSEANNGLNIVKIGAGERYEIPDAVMFGG